MSGGLDEYIEELRKENTDLKKQVYDVDQDFWRLKQLEVKVQEQNKKLEQELSEMREFIKQTSQTFAFEVWQDNLIETE